MKFHTLLRKKEPIINCLNSYVSNIPLTNKSDILNEFNDYYNINVGKIFLTR